MSEAAEGGDKIIKSGSGVFNVKSGKRSVSNAEGIVYRIKRENRKVKEVGKEKEFGGNYAEYQLSKKEYLTYSVFYLCLDGIISNLFFHSWYAFILLLPGIIFFFRDRKTVLGERRGEEMQVQFLTGMQLVCTSLQAGYAVENAFREALKELEKIYDADTFIIREFRYLVSQMGLNRTIESLLMDLGQRSHVEDIRNFAEVFYIAKRTGGDLMAIIQNTVSAIQQKQETRMEIATCLSGKLMEQNMMSVIPIFILGYVKLTSPGFLNVMYHNLTGVVIMVFCLILYIIAYFWGRKIMHIRV